MPLYRLGVFQKLSTYKDGLEFTLFGDTKEQGGIETIDWKFAQKKNEDSLRWVKTKNYFYKPELLLWQTGIMRRILFSSYKIFVFEGAISHLPNWLFALLCKICNKKVLFWTHGFKGLDNGLKKYIRTFFFKYLADGLLLYGHHQKKIMIGEGFSFDKIFVIYNSLRPEQQFKMLSQIDMNLLILKKQDIFIQPHNFTVIFIGRLVRIKRILDILKAVFTLKSQNLFINCIIIGDGPQKDELISYCQENTLESQIHFAGALYDEEQIAEYFAMSDLMISPGNVGLNCIHSLAFGVPVMTHDNFSFQNPEVEAIIEGETGSYFEYNNFDSLVATLINWIRSGKDKQVVIKKCHEKIKSNFNPDYQAKCIINAIKQIS